VGVEYQVREYCIKGKWKSRHRSLAYRGRNLKKGGKQLDIREASDGRVKSKRTEEEKAKRKIQEGGNIFTCL